MENKKQRTCEAEIGSTEAATGGALFKNVFLKIS